MFEKTYPVPFYSLEPNGRMKIGMLLQFFQDAADLHSRVVGISVDDLRRGDNTWVLRRYLIDIICCPGREDLTVRTWYEPRGNLRSLREFAAYDDNGLLIAKAWSSWIILNLQSGRPMRLDRVLSKEYYDGTDAVFDGPEGGIAETADADVRLEFGVRREELDINGHANHTAYIGWALESVPDEVARRPLSRIEAEYLYPAMREDVVVRTRQREDDPGNFVHSVILANTGKEAARLATTWLPIDEAR